MAKKWTWHNLFSIEALKYIATHGDHHLHILIETQYGLTDVNNPYYVDRYAVTCSTCNVVLAGKTTEGVRPFPILLESGHG